MFLRDSYVDMYNFGNIALYYFNGEMCLIYLFLGWWAFILFYFIILFYPIKLFFKFIYLFWERESESVQMGEGHGERGTEDPKWALCWQQRAQSGAQTHKPQDHDLSQNWMLNQLSHPGAPVIKLVFDVLC